MALAQGHAIDRDEGDRRFQFEVGSPVEEDFARNRAFAEVLEPGEVLITDASTDG